MSNISVSGAKLIRTYPIISPQMDKKRLLIILNQLDLVLSNAVEGEVVEFGCYLGTTGLFIRRMLDAKQATKAFHAYDSFEGLPAKSIEDASVAGSDFRAGELKVSKHDLVRNFKKAGLRPPITHKGWFSELRDKDVPEIIAFAFIDGDFYRSIRDSLELVWARLNVGGVIVVDDYMRSHLPGATRAVNDFFIDKKVKISQQNNLAIVSKDLK